MRRFLVTGLLALPFALHAQDAVQTRSLTLSDAVKIALEQDPEIGGLRAALRSARETEAQGSKYTFLSKNPDLRLGASREGEDAKGRKGQEEYTVGLRLFPTNPWELKARRSLLSAKTTTARDTSSASAFTLELEVRQLFLDALLEQDLAALEKGSVTQHIELRDTLERLLAEGQALLPAVVKSRANVIRAVADANVANIRALSTRQNLLNRMGGLTVPASQVSLEGGWPGTISQLQQLEIGPLLDRAIARRADLTALYSRATEARATARAASTNDQAWLTYVEPFYSLRSGTDADQAGLRFGINIPFGGPKNLVRLEALGEARTFEEQHSLLRRSIASQVRDAHDTLKATGKTWQELESQLVALRKEVGDLLAKPDSRQLYRPEDLASLQTALREAEESAVKARHAAHLAALKLDAAVGETCVPVLP